MKERLDPSLTIYDDFVALHPMWKVSQWKICLRLCADELVSERSPNGQNENDMNYKNSYRMKVLVFVQRQGLCWFSPKYVNKLGAFCNNSE